MWLNTICINPDDKYEGEFFKANLKYDIWDMDWNNYDYIEYQIDDDTLNDFKDEFERVSKLYNLFCKDAVADRVVRADRGDGVDNGIEELEKFGFDCSYYWEILNNLEDPDASLEENGIDEEEDDTYIECTTLCIRDRLFRRLGIYGAMMDAYYRFDEREM